MLACYLELNPHNIYSFYSILANFSIVDVDTNEEDKVTTTSTGSNFGLNLKADEKIFFGGLPVLRVLR